VGSTITQGAYYTYFYSNTYSGKNLLRIFKEFFNFNSILAANISRKFIHFSNGSVSAVLFNLVLHYYYEKCYIQILGQSVVCLSFLVSLPNTCGAAVKGRK